MSPRFRQRFQVRLLHGQSVCLLTTVHGGGDQPSPTTSGGEHERDHLPGGADSHPLHRRDHVAIAHGKAEGCCADHRDTPGASPGCGNRASTWSQAALGQREHRRGTDMHVGGAELLLPGRLRARLARRFRRRERLGRLEGLSWGYGGQLELHRGNTARHSSGEDGECSAPACADVVSEPGEDRRSPEDREQHEAETKQRTHGVASR